MSATSPSDTRSLRPTSSRSCASESGSGVASRSRAQSARENSRNRETETTWLEFEHQRKGHGKADDDDQPAHRIAAKAPGDPGAADAAENRTNRHDDRIRPDHEPHPDEIRG